MKPFDAPLFRARAGHTPARLEPCARLVVPAAT
ncbi:hypothetical protein QF030_001006 [Streptomyces rishiriensis]|uniref:Uncharacterized protein n=1 Tax=Streptomyces rishiriensis TaxID=68264 RepID=A0ABU0NJC5_STRRH|nr:hypothetical protein [Streptomyces rishiriensis]